MLNRQEIEKRMRERHESLRGRATVARNMLSRKEELLSNKTKYENFIKTIEEEKFYYKQARAFLVNQQDEKYKRDSETIKRSMQLASTLVKQKNIIEPRFMRRPGLRPESKIVVTRNGHPVTLSLTEGTGVAESIASLTILSVLRSTNYMQTVFWDEIYASVSKSNSESISKMLNKIIDEWFQAILIEQKDEIFQHTNYRDFRITFDGITSKVTTYDIADGIETIVQGGDL